MTETQAIGNTACVQCSSGFRIRITYESALVGIDFACDENYEQFWHTHCFGYAHHG
jgi:hypothetical protein